MSHIESFSHSTAVAARKITSYQNMPKQWSNFIVLVQKVVKASNKQHAT